MHDRLDLLNFVVLLDLINFYLLEDKATFYQQVLADSKLNVEEPTLVLKRNQDIWILHWLEEVVEFWTFFLFFFLFFLFKFCFFFLNNCFSLLVLKEKREIDLDTVLTFSV